MNGETHRNGLRDERGALIGGLVVEDYVRGMKDFDASAPPPDFTTASYDLGRQRAADEAEARRNAEAVLARVQRQHQDGLSRTRALLMEQGRPDLVAELDGKLAAIDADRARPPKPGKRGRR